MALPVRMADHHSVTARLRFFRRKEAPNQRLNSEDAKELGAHRGASRVLGCAARHHGGFTRAIVSHRLERGTLVVPILEVRDRDLLVE